MSFLKNAWYVAPVRARRILNRMIHEEQAAAKATVPPPAATVEA